MGEQMGVCVRTWTCMKRDTVSECACMLCVCDCKHMCVSVVCVNVGVWVGWMCACKVVSVYKGTGMWVVCMCECECVFP